MAPSKIPTTVNDFSVLPLQIPPHPVFPQSATHYLYIRAHAPRLPTDSTRRELFLANVPADATESRIFDLFADPQLGGARIENVVFERERAKKSGGFRFSGLKAGSKRKRGLEDEDGSESGSESEEEAEQETVSKIPSLHEDSESAPTFHHSGSTATVTFIDNDSAKLALSYVKCASKARQQMRWPPHSKSDPLLVGSKRYLALHSRRYPTHSTLQSHVDAYMSAYDAAEKAHTQLLARQRSEPDADGFVTVTRGGRNGPAREEATKAKMAELEKREKSRVREGFYRFQNREKKKAEAQELVKRYEKDQQKMQEMAQRRGRVRPES